MKRRLLAPAQRALLAGLTTLVVTVLERRILKALRKRA
jgi:hypothetical protein